MERAARLLIALSAVAAVGLQTYLGARAWAHLIALNATLFLLAVILGRVAPALGRWLVLLPAYVFPILIWLLMHGFDEALWSVWTSALLGYLIGRAPLSTWALPRRWRFPLGLWGLSVAMSWPIIVWREIDYSLAQLGRSTTGVTNVGISPAVECLWIAHVAATHLIGILWVDLLARDSGDRDETVPDRRVGPPLLASMVVSAGLAVYQTFGHFETLNPTIFGATNRAAGAMMDANAFGMAAAMWIAAALAFAAQAKSRLNRLLLVGIALLFLVAVWGSGSQSAFFAALAGVVGAVFGVWRLRAESSRGLVASAVAAVLALAVGAVVLQRASSTAVGPLARFEQVIQAAISRNAGASRPVAIVKSLWDRDRYGTAATAMIREFPLTGVGVGMFNTLVLDESLILGLGPQAPDNAQNWFRHELAEMGVVGSFGWIIWVGVFVPTLWKPATRSAIAADALRGALVGLGLASLIAMPTQNTAVLLTFWAFVFWSWKSMTLPVRPRESTVAWSRWWWMGGAALVVAYAGLVWSVGATRLRVPERAATVGWPYDRGFYDLETPPTGPAYRWTGADAVVAIPAPRHDAYLPLTFWVHHPDVGEHPVHIRIWVNRRLVVDMALENSHPVSRYVHVRGDERGVMVETQVDRTWQPASLAGGRDHRDLGLAVADWAFICCPPPGAVLIN